MRPCAQLNTNGSFVYTPNAAFTGTDSFTYKANDGVFDSNTVTVNHCQLWVRIYASGQLGCPQAWPIVAINSVVMRTGQVLIFERIQESRHTYGIQAPVISSPYQIT